MPSTMEMMLDRLYASWFAQADTNQDGQISGPEAVVLHLPRANHSRSWAGVWNAGSAGRPPWIAALSLRTICQRSSGMPRTTATTCQPALRARRDRVWNGFAASSSLGGPARASDLVQMKPVVCHAAPVGFSTLGYGSGPTESGARQVPTRRLPSLEPTGGLYNQRLQQYPSAD
jgi:hypothetical protein